MVRTRLAWLLVLLLAAIAHAAPPAHYRDFKLYTSSKPDPADANKITATMRLINNGRTPLKVGIKLPTNDKVGLAAFEKTVELQPRRESNVTFTFTPTDGFRREVLQGEITFDGTKDRDLFLTVQGRDEGELPEKPFLEKIDEKARVVATYTPRTLEAIRRTATGSADATGKKITLAKNGKSDHKILVTLVGNDGKPLTWEQLTAATDAPTKEFVEAVSDLQRCFEIKTGVKLPIIQDAAETGPTIRLAFQAGIAGQIPHPDAYHLRIGEDGNVLIESTTFDGLRNGIYGLLTEHLDCHWFQPRGLGEEIMVPADKTVTVPVLDVRPSPSFFSSPGMSWGNSPRWDRQNRAVINRGRMNFGHSWYGFINNNEFPYEKHANLYAKNRDGSLRKKDEGWTWTNFCTTEPEVIEIVARKVNAQFDANPDAIVMSLDPNDYGLMCLCDRCLALDKQYGQTKLDGTDVADRLIHFANEIHARLKPEHQKKYLGILIYGYQMELPISARPSGKWYAGTICQFPPRYDHTRPYNDPTSEKNRDFHRLVKGWGEITEQLGFYDYYGHYYFFGPWAIVNKIREDMPAFLEDGGTFAVIEAQPNFAMNGLNHYVAARLMWDANADVDALLEDLFVKYYGPAADPMRKFWMRAEWYHATQRPGTDVSRRVASIPEFWTELDG
jgi:hypothetical protein